MEIPDGGVSKNRAFTIFFPRMLFASAGIGGNTRLLFIHLQLLPAAPVTPFARIACVQQWHRSQYPCAKGCLTSAHMCAEPGMLLWLLAATELAFPLIGDIRSLFRDLLLNSRCFGADLTLSYMICMIYL